MAGALDGIRVVEVGEGKALAYGGKLLRDLGAEVIKVEPQGGDALRTYGPFPGDEPNPEHSGLFIFMNGGKRGTSLDLETGDGREGLTSLLEAPTCCSTPSSRRRRPSWGWSPRCCWSATRG